MAESNYSANRIICHVTLSCLTSHIQSLLWMISWELNCIVVAYYNMHHEVLESVQVPLDTVNLLL